MKKDEPIVITGKDFTPKFEVASKDASRIANTYNKIGVRFTEESARAIKSRTEADFLSVVEWYFDASTKKIHVGLTQ